MENNNAETISIERHQETLQKLIRLKSKMKLKKQEVEHLKELIKSKDDQIDELRGTVAQMSETILNSRADKSIKLIKV